MRALRAPVVLAAAAAAALVACGGLLFDQSNAFPCDFSRPARERDLVCAPGDVCGVDNLCRRWTYEGPQFEGEPTVPEFGVADEDLLHPRRLGSAVTAVSRNVTTNVSAVELHTGDGEAWVVASKTPLEQRQDAGAVIPAPASITMMRAGPWLYYTAPNLTSHVQSATGQDTPVTWPDGGLAQVMLWRGADGTSPATPTVVGVERNGAVGRIDWSAGRGALVEETVLEPGTGLPALVRDVGFIPRGFVRMPLFVTSSGILTRGPDGGTEDALGDTVDFGANAFLRFNERGTIAAVASSGQSAPAPLTVLSAFSVNPGSGTEAPAVEPLWSDCTPCPAGPLLGVYPVNDSDGLPAVDVLCDDGDELLLLRVVDGAGGNSDERCVEEYVEETMPLYNVARGALPSGGPRLVQDESAASGAVLGGVYGNVWLGESPASALPLYLDRVPLDVVMVQPSPEAAGTPLAGLELPVVLTDGYLAIDEAAAPALVQAGLANGFRRINLSEASAGFITGDVRPAALVHESAGWLVLNTGDLVRYGPRASVSGSVLDFSITSGPQLVNGRGDPVERPLWGEGLSLRDGGGEAAVIAADDSLYFLGRNDLLSDGGAEGRELTPVLTPEPGVFIRHLALERTPVGTDGVDRVRGYVVTSRSVHRFELSGSPPRWTSAPVVLSAGTPMEVWFDHPRGGLGRVGYQDGLVFTLPGGHQLTQRLAESADAPAEGEAPRVIDFENLGGWPVALTTRGLFVAQWEVVDGRLDYRFDDGAPGKPMTWRRVKLNGEEPWLDDQGYVEEGRLFVRADPEVTLPSGSYERTFHLLLFMEDEVLEVGQHVRHNDSPH